MKPSKKKSAIHPVTFPALLQDYVPEEEYQAFLQKQEEKQLQKEEQEIRKRKEQSCYDFTPVTFPDGLFEGIVDATYILHMKDDTERMKSIQRQINEYHLSKRIYIVNNLGFKAKDRGCEKPDWVQLPQHDIVHANYEIFRHAAKQGYRGNLLILEDDFIFDPKIKEKQHRDHIKEFTDYLNQRKYKCLYSLGSLPVAIGPIITSPQHYWGAFMGTQSVIINETYRNHLLRKVKPESIGDWDMYNTTGYIYAEPLCYQLFPETENQKTWANHVVGGNMLRSIGICIIQWLHLDKSIESYPTLYFVAKCIFFFFYILLLLLIGVFFYVYFRYFDTTLWAQISKWTKKAGFVA